MELSLNTLPRHQSYQKLYQNRLTKRIILEFIFGFVVMYLGHKIYPTSLLPAQPIYFSTAVVFALYSIRGYRISGGLFIGGVLAYYFSPETSALLYVSSKILISIIKTTQILFCAFFIRFLLDKFHMALVSMRNLKEIYVFIILSIIIPQLVYNILITPSIKSMVTGLGHTLGLLTIASILLVWNAYVPKLSPPPLSKKLFIFTSLIWIIMGSITYGFCQLVYHLTHPVMNTYLITITLGYLVLMLMFINLLTKLSNRFFSVIGMGFVGLSVLFCAISAPDILQSRELSTAYIQIGVIFISAFWLGVLAKLR